MDLAKVLITKNVQQLPKPKKQVGRKKKRWIDPPRKPKPVVEKKPGSKKPPKQQGDGVYVFAAMPMGVRE